MANKMNHYHILTVLQSKHYILSRVHGSVDSSSVFYCSLLVFSSTVTDLFRVILRLTSDL